MKQNKYSKLLKTWRVVKLTTPKLVYRSGDKEYFGFNRFGPLSSFCLKLTNRNIGINVAKINMNKFKNEIDRLKIRKQRKSHTK